MMKPEGGVDERYRDGQVLALLRNSADWTRAELAHAAAVPSVQISRVEQGRIELEAEDRDRLLRALGVPLEQWQRLVATMERTIERVLEDADRTDPPVRPVRDKGAER